ncbi:MAG: hypothetical protein JWO11_3572 [Nocardioides sp.]|nr:hypothetical protein [Nocardioides sp.]
MTAPNAFDPATIKLRADLDEARAVVGFFRPTIRPLLLSELTWRMAGWNGQRPLLEALVADILADGFVLKAAT